MRLLIGFLLLLVVLVYFHRSVSKTIAKFAA